MLEIKCFFFTVKMLNDNCVEFFFTMKKKNLQHK